MISQWMTNGTLKQWLKTCNFVGVGMVWVNLKNFFCFKIIKYKIINSTMTFDLEFMDLSLSNFFFNAIKMEKILRGAVFDYHFSKFLVAIRALFCLNECVGSEFTYRDANQDSSIIAYTIWYASIYNNILGNFNKYIVNIVLDIPKELEPSFL